MSGTGIPSTGQPAAQLPVAPAGPASGARWRQGRIDVTVARDTYAQMCDELEQLRQMEADFNAEIVRLGNEADRQRTDMLTACRQRDEARDEVERLRRALRLARYTGSQIGSDLGAINRLFDVLDDALGDRP